MNEHSVTNNQNSRVVDEYFFDESLIKKYDKSGPRYTSYPTALEFKDNFDNEDFIKAVKTSLNQKLSIYIHIPFCHSLCYYCGCNKVVTRNQDKLHAYLEYLKQEITQRAALFKDFEVNQLHFGGGTPSFLSETQLNELMSYLKRYFEFSDDAEVSIEIDPRNIELSYASAVAKMGFNRISLGVQDTNTEVQEAINRVQSTDFIAKFVNKARESGIQSVNLDLIYGLPYQTPENFTSTLDDIISMDPDRISLFSYAHLPERFAAQRKIPSASLPQGENKMALMKLAISHFKQNGYVLIGMDHFAKPEDELAQARSRKALGRNFQGYTIEQEQDLLGLGVTAISSIGNIYSQNAKSLKDYYSQFDAQLNCVEKGITLGEDDLLRRFVIKELMCNLFLDKQNVSETFEVDFDAYFAEELTALKEFEKDGLLRMNQHFIEVFEPARLFIRNICMCFDAYMKKKANQQRFSRII